MITSCAPRADAARLIAARPHRPSAATARRQAPRPSPDRRESPTPMARSGADPDAGVVELDAIIEQAQAADANASAAAQQQTDDARRRRRQEMRRDKARALLADLYEHAHQFLAAPARPVLLTRMTEQILLVGRVLRQLGVGAILNELPVAGRADDPFFLPLHYAVLLLRAGRDADRRAVRRLLARHDASARLQHFPAWLGGLADRLLGYERHFPDRAVAVAAALPLPADDHSHAAQQRSAWALGLGCPPPLPPDAQPRGVMPLVKEAAAAPATMPVAVAPPHANAADPPLSQRQREILQALVSRRALNAALRQSTQKIAVLVEGPEANFQAFKVPIAELRRRGLIATQEGRTGGCWLTPAGRVLGAHRTNP